jgi:hypothetical protein
MSRLSPRSALASTGSLKDPTKGVDLTQKAHASSLLCPPIAGALSLMASISRSSYDSQNPPTHEKALPGCSGWQFRQHWQGHRSA